jgi:hypothetical protein
VGKKNRTTAPYTYIRVLKGLGAAGHTLCCLEKVYIISPARRKIPAYHVRQRHIVSFSKPQKTKSQHTLFCLDSRSSVAVSHSACLFDEVFFRRECSLQSLVSGAVGLPWSGLRTWYA